MGRCSDRPQQVVQHGPSVCPVSSQRPRSGCDRRTRAQFGAGAPAQAGAVELARTGAGRSGRARPSLGSPRAAAPPMRGRAAGTGARSVLRQVDARASRWPAPEVRADRQGPGWSVGAYRGADRCVLLFSAGGGRADGCRNRPNAVTRSEAAEVPVVVYRSHTALNPPRWRLGLRSRRPRSQKGSTTGRSSASVEGVWQGTTTREVRPRLARAGPRGHPPEPALPRPHSLAAARKAPESTERGGFEPPMDGNAHTGFRDRRIQPLCHLSGPAEPNKLEVVCESCVTARPASPGGPGALSLDRAWRRRTTAAGRRTRRPAGRNPPAAGG
jgi:hypothetical protein